MAEALDLPSARKKLGLTQTELAERWGIDLATVWRWENRGVPHRGAGKALADALIDEATGRPAPVDANAA